MPYLDRFGVSMDAELLAAFDRYLAARGYRNRSEALRDLVRQQLGEARLREPGQPAAGVLTLLCAPAEADAGERVRGLLAAEATVVGAALHFPVSSDTELQVIVLRGAVEAVESLADRVRATRGVRYAHLGLVPLETGVHEAAGG
ncbi:MAG TPA: nickel-responsive transcriptional regulator NikR [Phycisphaerae bacterium]|nr:nickel-responsive transcriptional regulator NikR [Phycisphaerae bacterium]HNU45264.1 nickel-responsive transcriptional regulator NikR [Phycisphaerae bacterium]